MAAPSHRARLTEMWKRPTGRPVYHIFHYSRKAFTYERSTEYGAFSENIYNSISLGPRPFIDLRVCMRSDPQPIA